MKKILILIAALTLSACGDLPQQIPEEEINSKDTTSYSRENLELGLTFNQPNGWSITESTDTYLSMQNDLNPDQNLHILKFKRISDEEDIRTWYENSGFPAPSSNFEETIVDSLPALKDRDSNVYYVLDERNYYLITDCQDMACDSVDQSFFSNFVNSIDFTD